MNESEGGPWFAVNLKQAREAAGLSQQDLVRRVTRDLGRRFSQQTYSKIETGAQEPALSVAQSLAFHVGVDLAVLSRAPAGARAELEILSAARQAQDARQAAESAAVRWEYWRDELRRLVDAAGPGSAGHLAAEVLAAKLSWEED